MYKTKKTEVPQLRFSVICNLNVFCDLVLLYQRKAMQILIN